MTLLYPHDRIAGWNRFICFCSRYTSWWVSSKLRWNFPRLPETSTEDDAQSSWIFEERQLMPCQALLGWRGALSVTWTAHRITGTLEDMDDEIGLVRWYAVVQCCGVWCGGQQCTCCYADMSSLKDAGRCGVLDIVHIFNSLKSKWLQQDWTWANPRGS